MNEPVVVDGQFLQQGCREPGSSRVREDQSSRLDPGPDGDLSPFEHVDVTKHAGDSLAAQLLARPVGR